MTLATNKQLREISTRLTTKLRKANFPKQIVQIVIDNSVEALIDELVLSISKFVEETSKTLPTETFSKIVKVKNPNQTPQEILNSCGREFLNTTDCDILPHLPRREEDEVEVFFFKMKESASRISNTTLIREYSIRGLKPIDPYSLSIINKDTPYFSSEYPNATIWQHNDRWCYMSFDCWNDKRRLCVRYRGNGWHHRWWFAGVRK
jgi:hypothetical protein